MNTLLAVASAVFSLWIILAVRAAVRFLFRAPVTRFDLQVLGGVTILLVVLAGAYVGWVESLI